MLTDETTRQFKAAFRSMSAPSLPPEPTPENHERMSPVTVTVLLEFPVRPDAENVDEVLKFDLPATAAYPGNEGTEVLSDDARPDKLFLLTRWSTPEAYEAYSAWRQSPEGATRLNEIAAGAPTIHHFHTYLRF